MCLAPFRELYWLCNDSYDNYRAENNNDNYDEDGGGESNDNDNSTYINVITNDNDVRIASIESGSSKYLRKIKKYFWGENKN